MIKKSYFIICSLFIIIVINNLTPTLTFFLPEFIINILKTVDEIFVLVLFLFTILYKKQDVKILTLIGFYCLIGFASGIVHNAPSKILLLGFLLSIKSIVLAYSLSRWEFRISNLDYFFSKYRCFFYVVVFFFIVDLVMGEAFKNLLFLKNETRIGLNVANSFYRHPADLAFMSFFWLYYFTSFKTNKIWVFLSGLMGILTFRVKDIIAAIASLIIPFHKRKFLTFKSILIVPAGIVIFQFYMILLPGHYKQYFQREDDNPVARTALYLTSLNIARNDFPLGEGFGRYGGDISTSYYSPVYRKYGIQNIRGIDPEKSDGLNFARDTFWPMILGESGFAGFIIYSYLIYLIFKPIFRFSREYDIKDDRLKNYLIFSKKLIFSSLIVVLARPVFSSPPMYIVIFGIIGILNSIIRNERQIRQFQILKEGKREIVSI